MYKQPLNHLVCPVCATPLEMEAFAAHPSDGDHEIVNGLLRCTGGEHGYAIVRGVPRLLPDAFETFGGDVKRFELEAATIEACELVRHRLDGNGGGVRL